MTLTTPPSRIAMKLAIEAKSIGFTQDLEPVLVDAGFHVAGPHDGCNGLTDEAFAALWTEVEEALPLARYDSRIAREWAKAGQDIHSELMAERRAFCSHF
jgi:hypothetical protein